MTIEEAIRHYEESERINTELAKNCVSALAKNHNLENAEKCKQMIEWLRELQERRKAPEIITCGECRHRDPEDKKCDCGHDIIWQLPRGDNWYCADAKRRTDEKNLSE